MTNAEYLEALEDRVTELEDALAGHMRAVNMLSFTVEGDMRHEYLTAHAHGLAALPRELWPPAPVATSKL